MWAMRRLIVIAALGLVAACSPSGTKGPETTVPTAPTATTASTTSAVPITDPFAVPPVIDEAYVNRVLAALDAVEGNVLRRVVASGSVEAEATAGLRSIYNDPEYELELKVLLEDLTTGLDRIKRPPGNRRTVVKRLVSGDSSCVLAEVDMDFSELLAAPQPRVDEIIMVAIKPTQAGANPAALNPTPWSFSYIEVVDKGAEMKEQPCAR